MRDVQFLFHFTVKETKAPRSKVIGSRSLRERYQRQKLPNVFKLHFKSFSEKLPHVLIELHSIFDRFVEM